MAMPIVPQKRCSKCGIEYPATKEFFHVSNRESSGFQSACKHCRSLAAKYYYKTHTDVVRASNRRWEKANPDKVHAKGKRYREANPEKIRARDKRYQEKNPDYARARGKRYRTDNFDKIQAARKIRYKANPEKSSASCKRWREANPEKARAIFQRRLAKKRALPSTFTEKDWQYALEYFHGCCAYCGNPPSLFDRFLILHQDHFKSLNDGGGYTPDNIVPACQSCNFSKNAGTPQEWIMQRFGKRAGRAVLKRICDYFSSL